MSQTYSITSRFEDGAEVQFQCCEDEDILAAALRQDVRLLCQCRKAFCGSCKALCSEGDYELGSRINVQVLPPDEEEDGVVVTCDTYPRSDLILEFPYTSDRLGSMSACEVKANVVSVEKLSATVYRLVLQTLDAEGRPEKFDFVPGQYAEISTSDSPETRAFSLANLPNEDGFLEFLIRLVPGGYYAAYLENRAAAGQTITVRGPFGEFLLRDSHLVEDFRLNETSPECAEPIVFIGGSTGLAPLVSMLRELARRGFAGECHLFFGMQDAATMFYEKELRSLAKSLPGLKLHLALMDPPADWDGYRGNAVAAYKDHFASGISLPKAVYLCGPGPMIDAVLQACAELGVSPDRIHREEFVASGA
ncbi:MAG: hypothetical protein CVU17_09975 [Betaproteobacteria bacterium HGW-Betaproteobacteria-11]|nr:MAG: hypothetical protein CVU17_09975 [Betaproteobacteria bacterium HGW-Betaproteobacteria-11]